jgi:predicted porin
MKKSLLALAVLGAFTTAASAQSSVTLFGTLDMAGRYVKADGQSRRLSEATNGLNSSQLGFKGTEDLGGGLKAGFELLADLAGADTGSAPANGKLWNRRSVVKLLGNFGEVRLGRDYTPTFWNLTIFDASGTNGLGSSLNVQQLYGSTRADNSIGYFLPSNLGGFYGQAMVAASERGTELDKGGRYIGGRAGFAAGPFDVAFAASEWRIDAAKAEQFKQYNIGGSYDLGVAKILGYWDRTTFINAKQNTGSISAVIPFGQSEVHVGYDRSKLENNGLSSSVDQIKAQYVYNLSKRTALYSAVSRLSNKDATRLTLPGAAGPTTANGKSSGIEFGLRHFF